jgi:hypothetical protein
MLRKTKDKKGLIQSFDSKLSFSGFFSNCLLSLILIEHFKRNIRNYSSTPKVRKAPFLNISCEVS